MTLEPDDEDAPRTALSATESAEPAPARGSGCNEAPETGCGDCGGPHGSDRCDYPPLQETYPGSGIYE